MAPAVGLPVMAAAAEADPDRLGTVTRQTSNAYRLVLSGLAAIGAARASWWGQRNNYRPSQLTG